MRETSAYDKNRNPLKQTKYQSKEWPFKTKKSDLSYSPQQ